MKKVNFINGKKTAVFLGLILLITLSTVPVMVFATSNIFISEIMYDVSGADTGREWIEITNISTSPIDVSSLGFFQGGSRHSIEPSQTGVTNLLPNEQAVVASSPDKFKVDWPNYSGKLFKSSFSLKNTGEEVKIVGVGNVEYDLVNYPTGSADGNGLSIFRNSVNSVWAAASPTPGSLSSANSQNNQTNESSSSSETEASSSSNTTTLESTLVNINSTSSKSKSNLPVFGPSEKLKPLIPAVFFDQIKTTLPGTEHRFYASSTNLINEFIDSTTYRWNFGDGSIATGQLAWHSFLRPGLYTVLLEARSGPSKLFSKQLVNVLSSAIKVNKAEVGLTGFVEIKNMSKEEINISDWKLRSGDNQFVFGDNSFIAPNAAIAVSAQQTGFVVQEAYTLQLISPSDTVEFEFKIE